MPRPNQMFRCVVVSLSTVVLAGIALWASELGKAPSLAGTEIDAPPVTSGPAPKTCDLRPNFKKWGLAPRVQGQRGTCSVFVVIGAMEYALAEKQNRGTRLSVEFLNWALNQTTKKTQDGGFFSDLWRGYAMHGVCPEDDMPYRKRFDPAARPSTDAQERAKSLRKALRIHWIKEWDPTKGLNAKQLVQVKQTLARGYPICGGFLWPKKEEWKNNVLQMCPRDKVRDGHSVLLVGYRDDDRQPGGGVFLIRNSAGPSRDGMLSYEYAQTYMNDAMWIDSRPEASSHLPDGKDMAASDRVFSDALGALTAPPIGRSRRISSNEQPNWHDGNMDMTWLHPGQVLEMPVLEGPGVITHMWFTSHAGRANELNALSIRIYWDGRKEPGVEAPLGDFFAVGQGKPAVVESVPVQVSPTGALTCYWRMPFAKSARIVITNDNPDRGAGLYWQVDWIKLERLPPDIAYFVHVYRDPL